MRSRQFNHVILPLHDVLSTSQNAHPSNYSEQSIHTYINDPFNYRTRQMFRFLYFLACVFPLFLSFLLFLSAYLLLEVYCMSCGNRVSLASARL